MRVTKEEEEERKKEEEEKKQGKNLVNHTLAHNNNLRVKISTPLG